MHTSLIHIYFGCYIDDYKYYTEKKHVFKNTYDYCFNAASHFLRQLCRYIRVFDDFTILLCMNNSAKY